MKVQTLNENLIKALSGIKEPQVDICGVIVPRKPLLEALKINKQFGTIILESGKLTYAHSGRATGDYQCLRISLDHTVMSFYTQKPDYKSPHPAKLAFGQSNPKTILPGTALDTEALIKAIQFTMPCIANDKYEHRTIINLLLESKDHTLKLIAADGFQLAIASLIVRDIPTDKALIELADVVKLLSFLKALKPDHKTDGYPEVTISYQEKSVTFRAMNSQVTFNRQDGEFPDYQRLIPQGGTKVEFLSDDLYKAVKSAKGIARDGTGIVRLTFNRSNEFSDTITVQSNTPDTGDGLVTCDAKVEAHCYIAVDAKYLLSMLKLCPNTVMTLRLTTPSSPMVFECDDRQITIMPMSVKPIEGPDCKGNENENTEPY